jgi:hypothetical protein
MIRFLLVCGLLGVSASSHAACEPLGAGEIGVMLEQANEAIDDDDLVRHGQIYRQMQASLPCLEEQLPSKLWAEFLVGLSLVEFAMGREWKIPLEVALRVYPTVQRSFGPPEIRNFVPTAQNTDDNPLLPTDSMYYFDGVRIEREPNIVGLHIVQQLKNGVWNTRLLQRQPFPEDWRVQFEEVVEVPEDEGAAIVGAVSLLGGLGLSGQVTGGQSVSIPEFSGTGALVGLGSYGIFDLGEPVGVFWDLSIPFQVPGSMGVDVYAGASVLPLPVEIWVGGGVVAVTVEEANGKRLVFLPQPHLNIGFDVDLSESKLLDFDVGGGALGSGYHVRAHGGLVSVAEEATVGWQAGMDFTGAQAFLVEKGGGVSATTGHWRVVLRGGLAFR